MNSTTATATTTATTTVGVAESTLMNLVLWPSIGGITFLMLCSLLFGWAIAKGRTDDLAPRIANRPKGVVKNALLYHQRDNNNNNNNNNNGNNNNNNNNNHHSCIGYVLAWIGWAYHLTYRECILGIPGTGTRNGGESGPLLKTNLDAVVLMRFHALLFKISVVVAVLCTFVILPLNLSAGCDPEIFGVGTCEQQRNLVGNTGYMKTTIANIPPKLVRNHTIGNTTAVTTTSANEYLASEKQQSAPNLVNAATTTTTNTTTNTNNSTNSNATTIPVVAADLRAIYNWVPSQNGRISTIALCCVIIYTSAMILLALEWRSLVALRRKYFLEAAHYQRHKIEQNRRRIAIAIAIAANNDNDNDNSNNDNSNNSNSNSNNDWEENDALPPPYLTHPELHETPPSVGIYSVLYRLPPSMVTYDNTDGDGAVTTTTTLDRQLKATIGFFDGIISPEPGFSSSVAAVTILPDALLVADAWNQWTTCEMLLQKLRRVRRWIAERERERDEERKLGKFRDNGNGNSNSNGNGNGNGNGNEEMPATDNSAGKQRTRRVAFDGNVVETRGPTSHSTRTQSASNAMEEKQLFDFDISEYARSLGFSEEVECGEMVDDMGMEEFNIFAYECALLAGKPDSLALKRLEYQSIKSLRELEKDLVENDLVQAKQALVRAPDTELHQEDSVFTSTRTHQSIASNTWHSIRKRRSTATASASASASASDEVISSVFNKDDLKSTCDTDENCPFVRPRKSKSATTRLKLVLGRIFRGEEPYVKSDRRKYYGTKARSGFGNEKAFVTDLHEPEYAVVTFTTRHAAVIARQCLADGGGGPNVWIQADDIPIYPLADAPPFAFFPRGFKYVALCIYSFCPFVAHICARHAFIYSKTHSTNRRRSGSGRKLLIFVIHRCHNSIALLFHLPSLAATLSGGTQALLFSISPFIFQWLANSDGNSTSLEKSEQKAIIYFWYFYLIARFVGQIVWDIVLRIVNGDTDTVEESVIMGLTDLTTTVSTTLGPSALTVIIFQFSITWPAFYFVPLPLFATKLLRLDWINRALKGGGPGAEIPYRIYVDNGYIFACMTTLAPLCPLIGPFALLYFILIAPMLRWVLVFGYRPKFDGGGDKWPKLHHIIVTSLLMGQFITAVVFIVKLNFVAGFGVGFCIVPTLLYNTVIQERYLRPYKDAALLQTSRLNVDDNILGEEDNDDNYNNDNNNGRATWREREEYRCWLVDCHKASYLPTCLSGGKGERLTAEPAVVLSDHHHNNDDEHSSSRPCGDDDDESSKDGVNVNANANDHHPLSIRELLQRQQSQKGGILHRHRYNL
eukprot:jgi/Psemu1/195687/e_gw1.176.6.1